VQHWRNLSCGLALSLSQSACIDTGADTVSIPLWVAGTSSDAPFAGRNDWLIELQSAELAFGPLVLCAGATAGELCEPAHAEWLDSVVVDVLDERPKRAGEVIGFGGRVRSWMFDLGIVGLLTQDEPVQLEAARTLAGNSVRLVGTASKGEWTLTFDAAFPIQQDETTQRGVPVVQKSTTQRFSFDLSTTGAALRVRFDARPWLASVDFDSAVAALSCEDMSGCSQELSVAPESQAQRAIRAAIQASAPPEFEWLQASP
jgi:hypothetical protein